MPADKLDIYDFGAELLRTNDLDPVYVLLWNTDWESVENWYEHRRLRWLVAYFCFYHVGTASWMTDAPTERDYWNRMALAAGSKDFPRCPERRHFRGENARKSVAYLRGRGIESLFGDLVQSVYENRTLSVSDVMEYVQEWVGFGPWISFKVADMLERLDLVKVKFDDAAMFLFDSPREGASMLWEIEHGVGAKKGEAEPWAVARILEETGDLKAPPRYERLINAQEAETILCKYKSYMGGHYELGEDIKSCRKSLLRFAKTPTAQRLLKAGKIGGLW